MTTEKPVPAPKKPESILSAKAPDRALRSLLEPDEKLISSAVISTGIYWQGAAICVLGSLLMLKVFPLGALLAAYGLAKVIFSYLTQYYLRLILTDKRVIIRSGIINLDVVQMHHNKIESVELNRTLMGRFLGYGTILITGTGSRVTVVPFVNRPDSFRSALDKIIFQREEAKNN